MPCFQGEHPGNTSVDIVLSIAVGGTVTDDNSNHTMNVTFASNYSGSWVNYQTNSTVANDTGVNWTFTGANSYRTRYYWRVFVHDGICNVSYTFWYITFIPAIFITNVYPVNSSSGIPVYPPCYATFNSTYGWSMNVTWYFGSVNIIIGTDTDISNSTQDATLYMAINTSTTYTWKIAVNDGHGNWQNETYSFTTQGLGGNIFNSDNTAYGIIGFIGVLGFIGYILNKRRKEKDDYQE